jgi:hypothetical protein
MNPDSGHNFHGLQEIGIPIYFLPDWMAVTAMV